LSWDGLKAIWGSHRSNVYVAGPANRVLHYDGEAWTPQTTARPEGLTVITGVEDQVFAGGYNGVVLQYRYE